MSEEPLINWSYQQPLLIRFFVLLNSSQGQPSKLLYCIVRCKCLWYNFFNCVQPLVSCADTVFKRKWVELAKRTLNILQNKRPQKTQAVNSENTKAVISNHPYLEAIFVIPIPPSLHIQKRMVCSSEPLQSLIPAIHLWNGSKWCNPVL